MRDLLYPDSLARRSLAHKLIQAFGLFGYELVSTPPFEHEDVIERGLGTISRHDLLRFVEPDTGEVALLRPDITPQIARVVATLLSERPGPYRLAYQGTVIRRRRGRARRHRQMNQAGIECIGIEGPEADAEVISLAGKACESVGLSSYRIELRSAGIGRAALDLLPEALRPSASNALARKDAFELGQVVDAADLELGDRSLLMSLVDLYGEIDVIDQAREVLKGDALASALDHLAGVVDRLVKLGLGPCLCVDLGESRGMSYYTDVSFTLLADGPGEPVGTGGRYDNLLGHFDAPAPATGLAIDLDNLEWALQCAGKSWSADLPLRLVVGGSDEDPCTTLSASLRARGVAVARHSGLMPDVLSFARGWSYEAALWVGPDGVRAERLIDGRVCVIDPAKPAELDELCRWAAGSDFSQEDGCQS